MAYNKKKTQVKKENIYKKITDNILSELKKGTIPWVQSGESSDVNRFSNFSTDKPYRGINVLLLMMAKKANQFDSNYFLTFNQATSVAGISDDEMKDVRSKKTKTSLQSVNHPLVGQKSAATVVFNSPLYRDEKGSKWSNKESDGSIRWTPTNAEIKAQDINVTWIARSTPVWNLNQMSHVPENWLKKRVPEKVHTNKPQNELLRESAQDLIKSLDLNIQKSSTPKFIINKDIIGMPEISTFITDEEYFRTLIHEVGHWTGHESRLNRTFGRFGDENYAKEELVAELTSAFVCHDYGVDSFSSTDFSDHKSYIASWISILENNEREMMIASAQAEKAVTFIENNRTLSQKNEPQESVLEP
jgi:antirestriction protein ArdC